MSQSPATGALKNHDLLGIYCNDHLAASTGGLELVNRMLGRHSGTPYEEHLRRLHAELREEQDALRGTMAALSIPVRQYKLLASWIGEKLSRGKLNGHLLSRSPSSDLIEFEFIATAVLSRTTWEIERLGGESNADAQLDCARIFIPMACRRARRNIRALTRNQDARLKAIAESSLASGELGPEAPTD